MRILQVHNRYREPGGEAQSIANERRALEEAGHQVVLYQRDSREIDDLSVLGRLQVGLRASSSSQACREIGAYIDDHRPDVAHIHNTVPLITPAIYAVLRARGVPVVQALRNYRFFCASGTFYRAGRNCFDCAEGSPLPAVLHGCYRGSRLQSTAMAAMLVRNRLTMRQDIDAYVAVSDFVKSRFVAAGYPEEKLFVKPNFEFDPGLSTADSTPAHVFCFGRLAEEKGVDTLLRAWRHIPTPLVIAGDGPLRAAVEAECRDPSMSHVRYVGLLSKAETGVYIRRAHFVVVPSRWHEPFGRTVIEAYAHATPVLASRTGALTELVSADQTGQLFVAGDPADLASQARALLASPSRLRDMGRIARARFESDFSPEPNVRAMLDIYRHATDIRRASGGATSD